MNGTEMGKMEVVHIELEDWAEGKGVKFPFKPYFRFPEICSHCIEAWFHLEKDDDSKN